MHSSASQGSATSLGNAHQPPAFFPLLVERARGLNAAPPRPSGTVDLPPGLRDIGFADYHNAVTFKSEKSLWRDQPGLFEAQFFHMGHGYREPVAMFTVEGQTARAYPFSTDLFNYVGVPIPPPPDPATLNFTGLRLHAPINHDQSRQEFMVFQGATYMRLVGRGDYYGLSARGLAIDTGEAPGTEEFPRFTEMYIERPAPGARAIWVMALLESKRATGAYAMLIQPADATHQASTVEIIARVFMRESVKVLGVAPLTSMFLFGKEHPGNFGDYRPEVHDSDGLLMLSKSGEWLYRALHNPPQRTTVCTFRMDSPRGFGLVQRERNFAAYQDLNERYQERPSAWVEPLSDWGPGSIRLLEITTLLESDDNIGTMWVPDNVPSDGLSLHYRVHVGDELPIKQELGKVVGTRYAGKASDRGQFIVDFAGLPTNADKSEPHADVTVTGGRLAGQQLVKNPYDSGYRIVIDVAREQTEDVELRATVRNGAGPLTETWSYLWQPSR
ncbi:MAG: glucan biosynthesis protein [Myxococcaceae bacterium]|nr:glucan biosynthesis protein [Myxococcaceae bacterium]